MKKFKFKFDILLRIKEEKEKEAKEKYGSELQKKTTLEIENERLKKDLINYENKYLQSKGRGDKLEFEDIMLFNNYSEAVNLRIVNNNKKIVEIDENLIKLKEEFLQAMKEKKMFEKLKDKREKAYLKSAKKIIEKRIEDIAILRYTNKK